MRLAETVTFGGSGLDRAAHLRGDTAVIAEAWRDAAARVLPIWRGKPLIRDEAVAWQPTGAVGLGPDSGREALFLGRADDGAPRFAVDMSDWSPDDPAETLGAFEDPSRQAHPDFPDAAFAELRVMMTSLSARDAELAGTARALAVWHAANGYCPACGGGTAMTLSGWQRVCRACGKHHFPRTDPVVIMLITRGNETLVGRAPHWPAGMYSCLAGFVEPGETVEAAVRRETYEEAGIEVGGVDYLASQPWPFPASLMIGCHGEATSAEIRRDPGEIADARWITREDLMTAMAGRDPDLSPARPGAIARFLLTRWLEDRLTP